MRDHQQEQEPQEQPQEQPQEPQEQTPPQQPENTATNMEDRGMGSSNAPTVSIQEQANRLYRGKALAPMVRASTTPLRTLALEYGADFVYSEELVDRSVSQTTRHVNSVTGTIDYIKDPSQLSKKAQRTLTREQRACLLLRLDPSVERGKVVCQLGTGEPELALEAAKHVYHDFAGIDINMGCPKKFSISGGMGSALLMDPDRAARIISTLRQHIPRPISCKIRLLVTADETVAFVERMIAAGVNAVAIHARRPGHADITPADWGSLKDVMTTLRARHPTFPFLLNGDFYNRNELELMLTTTKASGVLLGRPALYNTSIFRPLPLALEDNKTRVIQRYLQHSARYDIHFKNPKYVVCEMMNNRRAPPPRVPTLPQHFPGGQTIAKTCASQSMKEMFTVWNVEWLGVGKANVSVNVNVQEVEEGVDVVHSSHTTTTTTTSTEALAPGEHRYDDSYFLKKRPASTIASETVSSLPDAKRVKGSAELLDEAEEKKMDEAYTAIT